MRRNSLIVVAVSAAAFAAAPPAAHAARNPTKRELRGVAKAIGIPSRCAKVRVDTVRGRSYRYAGASIRVTRRSCMRYAADGVVVFKRKKHHSRWRFVTSGSAFDCPIKHVPRAVTRDLKLPCQ
jgi:hypothetical protein